MAVIESVRIVGGWEVDAVGAWFMALLLSELGEGWGGSTPSGIVKHGGDLGSGKLLNLTDESASIAALRRARQASFRRRMRRAHSPGLGLTETDAGPTLLDEGLGSKIGVAVALGEG